MDLILALYIIVFIIAIISMFKIEKNSEKVILISLIMLMIMLAGFRNISSIGYDTAGHLNYFLQSSSTFLSALQFKEPGYGLLSWGVSIFGGFQLFLIVISILSMLILYKSIRYFSLFPLISLSLYVMSYFAGNNLAKLRQSTAVLILLFSLQYLYKKRILGFFIVVLIAATFHTSALIFLILPLLIKIKLNKNRVILIFLFSVFIYFSGLPIIIYREWLPQIMNNISFDFLNFQGLIDYTDSEYTIRESGGLLGFLFQILLVIPIVFFYKRIKQITSEKTLFVIEVYFWGSIIFITLFDLALLNSRLSMPFLMAGIFAVPNLIALVKKPYDKIFIMVLFLTLILTKTLLNYLDLRDLYYPFEFFWEK
jgi:hypothetical protein